MSHDINYPKFYSLFLWLRKLQMKSQNLNTRTCKYSCLKGKKKKIVFKTDFLIVLAFQKNNNNNKIHFHYICAKHTNLSHDDFENA